MSNELRSNEPGTQGAIRIFQRQVKKALEELQDDSGSLSDAAVHDARKKLKKARAALRLVRDALGSRRYRRENAALRDAARPLTDVRDAKVLEATVDKLAGGGADGKLAPPTLTGLKQRLRQRRCEVRRRVLEEKDSIAGMKESLDSARRRIKKAPLGRHGWSVLGPGLKRVYRNAQRAFAEAKDQYSSPTMHEWRKQTKYLWHQLQMIEPIWPAALEAMADQFHLLVDRLGDDHDLVVLRATLRQQPSLLPDGGELEALASVIDCHRTELQRQAFDLGSRLYVDTPKQFTKRLGCHWRMWSSKTEKRNGGRSC